MSKVRLAHTALEGEKFVTKDQLAERLSYSCRWVDQQVKKGMPHHMIGRRRRFLVSEVVAWFSASSGVPS